jgi:hypothetical protein
VMVMDTDHSPFFSAPDHLLELILKSLWLVVSRIRNPSGGLTCSLSYVICQFELPYINRLFVSCPPQNIILHPNLLNICIHWRRNECMSILPVYNARFL